MGENHRRLLNRHTLKALPALIGEIGHDYVIPYLEDALDSEDQNDHYKVYICLAHYLHNFTGTILELRKKLGNKICKKLCDPRVPFIPRIKIILENIFKVSSLEEILLTDFSNGTLNTTNEKE